MNNNNDTDINNEIPEDESPKLLGTMTLKLDFDAGSYVIEFSEASTGKLVAVAEAHSVFCGFATELFCKEVQRRKDADNRIIIPKINLKG